MRRSVRITLATTAIVMLGSTAGLSPAQADPECGKIGAQLERDLHRTTASMQEVSQFQDLSRLNSLHAVCQKAP